MTSPSSLRWPFFFFFDGSTTDRFIKAMNASSREHDCSSFMEKAGEFLTLREHTTLLPSHVEEIDTATAGSGSDGEVAPNEKKAR